MTASAKGVGRRIAQLRRDRRLTQEGLAQKARLDYRHFQKIEAGNADLRLETILRIARALDVSPSMLLDHAGEPLERHTTRYYREILDRVPFGIQINDPEGTITYSNPAHRVLHGYPTRELIGKKKIWDLVATDAEREELKRYFPRLCTGKAKILPFFTRNRRKDGSLVEVRVDWRYLYDQEGKLIGFLSGIVPTGDFSSRGNRI